MPKLSHDLPTAVRQIEGLYRQLPSRERTALAPEIKALRDHGDFMAMRDELDATRKALELYRKEYKALVKDTREWERLVDALLSDPELASLRFTPRDIQRAFDKVGTPSLAVQPDEETSEILVQAALFLADDATRTQRAQALWMKAPGLLAGGRYLDACIAQHLGCEALDMDEGCGTLMWRLFLLGLQAWMDDRHQAEEATLRELGFDLDAVKEMDDEERIEWFREQFADPEKQEAMERMAAKTPPRRYEAIRADHEAMLLRAMKLLKREDARFLYLSGYELDPWWSVLAERLKKALDANGGEVLDEARSKEVFEQRVIPMIDEMAVAIFTPDRVAELLDELSDYERDLKDAGEKSAAKVIGYIRNSLVTTPNPGEHPFVQALCQFSVSDAMQAMQAAQDEDETE